MTKGVITKYDGTHTVGTDINIFHYRGHHLLPGRHIGALIPRLHLDIEFGESSIFGPVTTLLLSLNPLPLNQRNLMPKLNWMNI